MPIYEYECRGCVRAVRTLVRTEGTRQNSFNKARARAKLTQRDKDVAQAEYEKKHHEEGH